MDGSNKKKGDGLKKEIKRGEEKRAGWLRLKGNERQTERSWRRNKQRQVNVNGDGDLVVLNIDSSVMGHEIYMKH